MCKATVKVLSLATLCVQVALAQLKCFIAYTIYIEHCNYELFTWLPSDQQER